MTARLLSGIAAILVAGLLPLCASAAATYVQAGASNCANGTAPALVNPPTNDNVVVALEQTPSTTLAGATIKDSNLVSYLAISNTGSATFGFASTWNSLVSGSPTKTYAASVSGEVCLFELNGVNPVQSAVGPGRIIGQTGTSSPVTVTFANAQAGDAVICAGGVKSASTNATITSTNASLSYAIQSATQAFAYGTITSTASTGIVLTPGTSATESVIQCIDLKARTAPINIRQTSAAISANPAFMAPPLTGDVVSCVNTATSSSIGTVTDSNSVALTKQFQETDSSTLWLAIYDYVVSGTPTITYTFSAAGVNTSCIELSGATATGALYAGNETSNIASGTLVATIAGVRVNDGDNCAYQQVTSGGGVALTYSNLLGLQYYYIQGASQARAIDLAAATASSTFTASNTAASGAAAIVCGDYPVLSNPAGLLNQVIGRGDPVFEKLLTLI